VNALPLGGCATADGRRQSEGCLEVLKVSGLFLGELIADQLTARENDDAFEWILAQYLEGYTCPILAHQ
jgi:hypothetical protein